MSLLTTLAIRGLTFLGALLVVLSLVAVVLGATGFSDRMLNGIISEELRGLRQSLAQTIRNPDQLEQVLHTRRQQLISYYHLDKPWYFRLPDTVKRVLALDLGESRTFRSFKGSSKVANIVKERIPYTILLFTTALIITAALGLLIGVKLATQVGSKLDRGVSFFTAFSYALPGWWAAIFLILLFCFKFSLFPPGGLYSLPPPEGGMARFLDLLWHALLPIFTLILVSLGPWIYVTRAMVLNTAQESFVTVARAKGLPDFKVRNRYILRVVAPPIATNLLLAIAGSLGGSILIEIVFNWPGMGQLYYQAVVVAADESMIIALTFMYTLIYVVARFILEVLYVVLDPRIRYT